MRKDLSTWIGRDIVVIGVALGLAGCDRLMAKDAFQALEIQQVQVLDAQDCTIPGAPTSAHKSGGTLDLGLPDGFLPPYMMAVSVINNLTAVGGNPADEMNNMNLTHFTVELDAPGVSWNDSCPQTFDTPASTVWLPPGGTTGAAFYAITSAHSACIQPYVPPQELLVTIKMWAKGRHGGTAIESAPFIFPVEVCIGCLQQAYFDPAIVPYRYPADVPMCSSFIGNNPYLGAACVPPGQDGTIFCCGVETKVNNVTQAVAVCPGTFTGSSSTGTGTSTTH